MTRKRNIARSTPPPTWAFARPPAAPCPAAAIAAYTVKLADRIEHTDGLDPDPDPDGTAGDLLTDPAVDAFAQS
ncbi:hypothetical protein [Streptomyces sp. NPDC059009]|uniref:hypothetical protein n=1 Tax=Streptomyces sp. NPDC059009 TaxID=3346694 RepID=UPI0036AB4968